MLECLICREPFSVNGDHIPLTLVCNHVICRQCVIQLWSSPSPSPSPSTITCPVCRSTSSSPIQSIKDIDSKLKPHLHLLHLLTKHQEEEEARRLPPQHHLCEGCDGEATLYCQTCDMKMCEDCHPRWKKVRYSFDFFQFYFHFLPDPLPLTSPSI